ncbi:hypothetical protein BDR04DRAFT_412413 [Suillus decipiens]|nr:hypothetical protein BDR04DRAFT_412413 [Suillus decipiens]
MRERIMIWLVGLGHRRESHSGSVKVKKIKLFQQTTLTHCMKMGRRQSTTSIANIQFLITARKCNAPSASGKRANRREYNNLHQLRAGHSQRIIQHRTKRLEHALSESRTRPGHHQRQVSKLNDDNAYSESGTQQERHQGSVLSEPKDENTQWLGVGHNQRIIRVE